MPRPICLSPAPSIPSELTDLRQWVAWKYVVREGKPTKIPCGRYGTAVDVRNEQEWMSHAEASQVPGMSGVGFVFSDAGPYCGVDLDSCRHADTGDFEPEALDMLEKLGSYAEVSPSKTGAKVILRARMAEGSRHKVPAPWKATSDDKHAHVECYDRGRFFTITGEVLPGYHEVTATGAAFINETMRDARTEAQQATGTTKTTSYISDADLVDVARLFPGTAGIMAGLYVEADRQKFGGDESRCDYALCLALARHTDKGDQIERVFKNSRLYLTKDDGAKSKWDRPDYVHRTVQGAIREKTDERARDLGLNYRVVRSMDTDKDGDPCLEETSIPLTVLETTNQLQRHTGGAFFLVGKCGYLAAERKGEDPLAIDCHSDLTAALGFRKDMCIRWKAGVGFTTREEGFAALCQTSPRYHSVETVPTFPAWPDTYYNVPDLPAPNPEAWEKWLDFFNWASPEDRLLGEALFLTPFWGGPGGQRPILAVASPDGQQSGKTTVVQMAAALMGQIPVSVQTESGLDVGKLLERLLSSEGRRSRVVLLDNVTGRLNNGDLAALITGASVSGRELYAGEGTRPNTLTYCLTLNAPSLDTDFATRTVEIRILRPRGGFGDWVEKVQAHLSEHRWGMIAHAIAKLRAAKPVAIANLRFPLWVRQVLGAVMDQAAADRVAAEIFRRREEHNSDADDVEAFSHALMKTALEAVRAVKPQGNLEGFAAWIYNPVVAGLFSKTLNRRSMAHSTALKQLMSLNVRGDFKTYPIVFGQRRRINGQHLTGVVVGTGNVVAEVEESVDTR